MLFTVLAYTTHKAQDQRDYNVSNPRSKYYGWHYTDGQKPNDFPQEAYKNKQNEISKIIDKEIDKAISKL